MLKKLMKAALVAAMVCAIGCGAQAADFIVGGGHGGGGGAATDDSGGSAGGGGAGSAGYAGAEDGRLAGGKGGDGHDGTAGGAGGGTGDDTAEAGEDGTDGGADAAGGKGAVAAQDGEDQQSATAAGAGGDGANFSFDLTADLVNEETVLRILGGAGGSGGAESTNTAGDGGDGGDAIAKLAGDVTVGSIVLKAGAAGEAGDAAAGAGGNAILNGNGKKLTVYGDITVQDGGADGAEAHFGNDGTGTVANLDLVFAGNSTINLIDSNATTDSSFTTKSFEILAGTSADARNVVTIIEQSTGDFTAGSTFQLGHLKLGGNTELSVDKDISAALKGVTITGANNTIINAAGAGSVLNFAGNGDNTTLTFDMTGVLAGQTMLYTDGNGVDSTNATTKLVVKGSTLKYGETATLVDNLALTATWVLDGYDQTATRGSGDNNTTLADGETWLATNKALNTVDGITYGVSVTVDGGDALTARGFYYVNANEGAKEIFAEGTVQAATGDVYGVTKGSVIFQNDANYAGVANASFKAQNLVIEGNSQLDFTAMTAAASMSAVGGNFINTIEMLAGSNLNMLAQDKSGWAKNLITHDSVTLNDGFDLKAAKITSNLSEDFDLANQTIISGKVAVDAKTTVAINAVAEQEQELLGGQAITIFNTNVTGIKKLDTNNITVKSEAFDVKGTFDPATGKYDNVVATLNSEYTNEAHSAGLAAQAGMSLLNGGADSVEKALGSFTPLAMRVGSVGGMQVGGFASFGGESVEVDTGSSVEADNLHLVVGPGLRINGGSSRMDVGAFFEAGWGNYDAFNGGVHGDGDTEYYGGGLLFRYENCNGFYGEASARFGSMDMSYDSQTNSDHTYDFESGYAAGHIGFGYILRPTEEFAVDVFAKGFMTSMDGDTQRDVDNRVMDMDDSTSIRSQLGAKFSYNINGAASMFVKGAWEHEFDGETNVRYANTNIRSSDIGGSSFIGAVGFDVRIAECATLGASVYGVTGQRDGFGGNINLAIGF